MHVTKEYREIEFGVLMVNLVENKHMLKLIKFLFDFV